VDELGFQFMPFAATRDSEGRTLAGEKEVSAREKATLRLPQQFKVNDFS
jgi:hypothetical protein